MDDDPVYTGDAAPVPPTFPFVDALLGLARASAARPGCRSRTCAARAARSCTASRSSSTTAASGRTSATCSSARASISDVYEKEKSDGGKLEFYVTETTW